MWLAAEIVILWVALAVLLAPLVGWMLKNKTRGPGGDEER